MSVAGELTKGYPYSLINRKFGFLSFFFLEILCKKSTEEKTLSKSHFAYFLRKLYTFFSEARTSIELTKVLLQQDAKNEKMGQLLNGLYDLESDDDSLEGENFSPVTSKSSMDSDEYNMRRQFTQR